MVQAGWLGRTWTRVATRSNEKPPLLRQSKWIITMSSTAFWATSNQVIDMVCPWLDWIIRGYSRRRLFDILVGVLSSVGISSFTVWTIGSRQKNISSVPSLDLHKYLPPAKPESSNFLKAKTMLISEDGSLSVLTTLKQVMIHKQFRTQCFVCHPH